MGSLLSHLGLGGSYDIPDSATGLTPREKQLMRDTWTLVKKDAKNNAVEIFMKLFSNHPDYQKMFKPFADVSRDQLPSNPNLQAHAVAVLYAVSSLVDNLDDVTCLQALLHKIAISHSTRPVDASHFESVSKAIVEVLKEKLGAKMTPQCVTAWEKAFKVINSIINQKLEESRKETKK